MVKIDLLRQDMSINYLLMKLSKNKIENLEMEKNSLLVTVRKEQEVIILI